MFEFIKNLFAKVKGPTYEAKVNFLESLRLTYPRATISLTWSDGDFTKYFTKTGHVFHNVVTGNEVNYDFQIKLRRIYSKEKTLKDMKRLGVTND